MTLLSEKTKKFELKIRKRILEIMIIRNHASSSACLFKTADNRQTDHSQWSTAHLIEPQTFFSMVSGEKADNQTRNLAVSPLMNFVFFLH